MNVQNRLPSLVEALLFVAEKPLPAKELAEFLPDAGLESIETAIAKLGQRYADSGSGLQVEEVAGG